MASASPIQARRLISRSNGWGLSFIGLSLYTVSVVTFRVPGAELGIFLGVLGILFGARDFKARFPLALWALLAFIVWAIVSAFFSIDPEVSRDEVVLRAKLAIVFFVAANAFRTEVDVKRFLIIASAAFLLYPARGALVNYFTGYRLFGRALWNGIYSNPNDLAGIALLFLGVAIALAATPSATWRIKVYSWMSGSVFLVLMFLTQSRGAFLGLAFGLLLPALRWAIRARRRVFLAAALGLIVGFIVPSSAWERFGGIVKLTNTDTIASADAEGSAAQRYEIQQVAIRIISDNPLLGVGLGCYAKANALYSPKLGNRDTHNTYFNLAAEVGIPGLCLWLTYILTALYSARVGRKRQSGDAALMINGVWIERAVFGFMVAAAVATYSALNFPYIILGALSGLVVLQAKSSPVAAKMYVRGDR